MSGGLLHACVGVADGWEASVEDRRTESAWRHLVLLEASVPGASLGTDGVPIQPAALSRAVRRGVKQLPTQPGFVSRPLGLTARRLSLRRSDSPAQLTLHALVQPPHLFCCLGTPDFPEELAKRLCDELALLWLEERARLARREEDRSRAANQIGVGGEGGGEGGTSSTHAARGPGGLSDALAALLERHADPERQARILRLCEIQQSASETVDLMSENVSRLLSNADDIEALEATQHGLSKCGLGGAAARRPGRLGRTAFRAASARVTGAQRVVCAAAGDACECAPPAGWMHRALTLQAKSVSLLHQSLTLQRGVQEVRRAARCKLYKMNLLCGLGCVLTTAGLTVLVLVLTHAVTITIN